MGLHLTQREAARPPSAQPMSLADLRARLKPLDAVDVINEVLADLRENMDDYTRVQLDARKLLVSIAFRTLSFVAPPEVAANVGVTAPKVTYNLNFSSKTKTGNVYDINTDLVSDLQVPYE